jgi:Flp pilus assembly protein TadD
MRFRILLAVGAFALVGACATSSYPEISPLQRTSNSMTPETADTFALRGMYAQAITGYRAALKANPEDAASRYSLAEALRKSDKFNDARTEFTALLAEPDWKLRALEGLGRTSFAMGDRIGALESFNQVVAVDAQAWGSWLGIAQIHDLNRNWAQADRAYALAVSAAKEPAIIYNNHGVSKLARGDAAGAAELFRSALAADAKFNRAANNLELAEAVAGRSVEAISASEQDGRERARKLNNYGYVAMLQNRPDEARAFYLAAIKEHPSFYPLAYQNLKELDASKNAESAEKKAGPATVGAPSRKPKESGRTAKTRQ